MYLSIHRNVSADSRQWDGWIPWDLLPQDRLGKSWSGKATGLPGKQAPSKHWKQLSVWDRKYEWSGQWQQDSVRSAFQQILWYV